MQISNAATWASMQGVTRRPANAVDSPLPKAVTDVTQPSVGDPTAPQSPPNTKPVRDLVTQTGTDQDLERLSQTLFEKLQGAFGAFEGDENYDATLDFDKDGEIGPSDFVAVSKLYTLMAPQPPVAQQVTKAETVEATDPLSITDVPGNGVSDQRVESARDAAFRVFEESFGAFKGDENYRAELDFDNDGEIGPSDFSILSQVWDERF